jgi:general secretion pathway protein D
MQKIIVLLVFLISSIFAADFQNITLDTFINYISKYSDETYLVDESIKDTKISLYTNKRDITAKTYKKILQVALKKHNFILSKDDHFFYISKLNKIKNKLYSLNINNHTYKDFKNLANIFDINSSKYHSQTNKVFFKSNYNSYIKLKKYFKNNQEVQKKLQLILISVDTNKVKNKGLEFTSKLKGSNLFLNVLATPFKIISDETINFNQFNIFLNLLNQKGYTKILSSPTLLIRDKKKVQFSIVKTIPYLKSTIQKEELETQYDYKDIGLKVAILPTFKNNKIDIDLTLKSEDVEDTNNQTPTTSSKNLNISFLIKENETIFLSGLNRETKDNNIFSIPFLSNIPFLGKIFTYEYKTTKETNLVIVARLIK